MNWFLWGGLFLIAPFVVMVFTVSISILRTGLGIQSLVLNTLIVAAYTLGIILLTKSKGRE